MNEEPTENLNETRSFEERVFARFDAFDERFDSVDARLERLETRSYDTKPIWERALKAIMDLGMEMGDVKTKVSVIEGKVGVIEGKVGIIEDKVSVIEGKVSVIEGKVGVIEGKVGIIEDKVGVIEGKVDLIETEVSALTAEVRLMKADYAGINDVLTNMKRELKYQVNKRLDLILEFLLEGRVDLRDAEERIKQLETKLA
jgi:predicted  nucleic acid-binding Zn-ribbon protein